MQWSAVARASISDHSNRKAQKVKETKWTEACVLSTRKELLYGGSDRSSSTSSFFSSSSPVDHNIERNMYRLPICRRTMGEWTRTDKVLTAVEKRKKRRKKKKGPDTARNDGNRLLNRPLLVHSLTLSEWVLCWRVSNMHRHCVCSSARKIMAHYWMSRERKRGSYHIVLATLGLAAETVFDGDIDRQKSRREKGTQWPFQLCAVDNWEPERFWG